jgi:hypothetical protein
VETLDHRIQTRTELEKRAEYKKKLFELAKLKGYDREKTERLLTFVLYLMQLPKNLEADMKSFYRKNKNTSVMATATQTKPKKKERLSDNARFVRDLSYEFAYGKSYDEIYSELLVKAKEDAAHAVEAELLAAKQLAAEESRLAAAMQIEQSITTMFPKTGWTAEKIADISGFSFEMVKEVVDKLK